MTDVAQLGLAIDSRQTVTATAALDRFAASAGAAGRSADNLATSGAKSDTVMRAIDAAAKRSGISVSDMTARVDANSTAHSKLVEASNTAVKAMTNVSAQSKQVANDNVAMAKTTDNSSSSLDKLANTLTKRVLFAAAAKEVRDFAAYVWGLNTAIAATTDSAARSGVGGSAFQGLQTAGAFKGINNDAFNGAMVDFNKQVDLAKAGVGDLQMLLKGNGKTVSDTATTFGVVADLVKNAGTEAQKFSILQQAGLPATREFAKLMEQGGASIQKQADAATKLSQAQLDKAKEVDEAWQRGWTNFENWGKRATVNVFGAIGTGLGAVASAFAGQGGISQDMLNSRAGANLLRQGQGNTLTSGSDVNGLYNAVGAFGKQTTPGNPTADIALQKQQNALAQQRLSVLGDLSTVEDQVKAKELELAAAGLNLYGVNTKQRDALLNITRAQAENTLVQNQAASGVFNLNLANKAAADTLQSWIDRKLLDPTNTNQMAAAQTVLAKRIQETSDAAQVAGSRLPQLTQLGLDAGNTFKQLDTFGVSTMNGLSSSLVDIATNSVSASDGFRSFGLTVLKALEQMIVQLTIIKPLTAGLGGIFGGLFGGNTTGSLATDGIGGFGPTFAAANGGTFGPGWGVVGERGPELINVHSAGVTVIPNHVSKPFLPGFADGGTLSPGGNVSRLPGMGQDNAPNVTIIQNNSFTNADPGSEARMRQALAQTKDQAVKEAVQQVSQIKSTSPSYLRSAR